MNSCLCLTLILIKSCLVLSSDPLHFPYADMRDVQAHPAERETVSGSNMSNYSTLPPKSEPITPTKPSVNTELFTTKSKHLISASTCVPPSIPTAGPRFHAGSFIGGMMLAFIIILAVTLGYRLACSQREVRYRAIEEHDAII
ncbi:porimin isoform X1 [Megalobrama amblycephala]|uniref:porimin isoform X1 n=1 Tax=Megalobrama amblycephala TaxID=75352 RepID=UPI002014462F|nr:porimin isoform X1 [Megalobrama amblycephala]